MARAHETSTAKAMFCPELSCDIHCIEPSRGQFSGLTALGKSPVTLGAQTMCYADSGAFTGEISPCMLLECGVRWVILRHSEWRRLCGETDDTVNRKSRAALAHGITPIVAVGDTVAEHAAGTTFERVSHKHRRHSVG